MHRYRMAAQISLILSILNLVLAATIVVQEVHEARRDELVVVEDVAAMPKKPEWRKLEAIDLSPRASSDAMASPEEIASPEHGSPSEESIGSGYPTPPVSPDRLEEALPYLWLMDRPQRMSLHPPTEWQGSILPPRPPSFLLSEGWRPSLESISEGSASLHPPMLVADSDKSEFFNKNMMKKIGIVVGALIVSGTIVGTVGSQKHHKHRDCQDS
ncbi:hypothetical protein BGY98DRAFT_1189533 [Russula aff. rugulosa BPL654]|nr:hypothetical protein BGY98DRAFT_1189533 [Russula aff. rugulosa BPL654]